MEEKNVFKIKTNYNHENIIKNKNKRKTHNITLIINIKKYALL